MGTLNLRYNVVALLVLCSIHWELCRSAGGLDICFTLILIKVLWLNSLHCNENWVNNCVLDCLWHDICLVLSHQHYKCLLSNELLAEVLGDWILTYIDIWVPGLPVSWSCLVFLKNLACGLVCVSQRKWALVIKIALVFKSLKYVLSLKMQVSWIGNLHIFESIFYLEVSQ